MYLYYKLKSQYYFLLLMTIDFMTNTLYISKCFLLIIIVIFFTSCTNNKKHLGDYSIETNKILMGGFDYYNGNKIEKDYFKAFKKFKEASDKNNGYGHLFVGYMYAYGKGVNLNNEMANKFYLLAGNEGVSEGKFHAAKYYISPYPHAYSIEHRRLFKTPSGYYAGTQLMWVASQEEYLYAQILYSFMIIKQYRIGYTSVYNSAQKILDKAIQNINDNKEVYAALGAIYSDKGDYEDSLKYLKISANKGSVIGAVILAKNYLCNIGSKYSLNEALIYKKVAIINGAKDSDLKELNDIISYGCKKPFQGDIKGVLYTYSAKDAVRDYIIKYSYKYGVIGLLTTNKLTLSDLSI